MNPLLDTQPPIHKQSSTQPLHETQHNTHAHSTAAAFSFRSHNNKRSTRSPIIP
ncbi:hypothetical protein K492DRAFT_13169 [Lichtheimia hyalospora FSU 10163]|nr:hypothetical protein K492DRAFT_13169 [Lichtheimia hyalospora FSU 10163]